MTEREIKHLISEMTLQEKAGMCSGEDFWHLKSVERLGIPKIMVTDGPSGLRKQNGKGDHLGLGESIEAVCFPASCATASSFDTELLEDIGKSLGNECQAEDVAVLLGPGINIKRSPLCGRNFEYFSEDPYLTGKLAAAYIVGVQSQGVGTSVKHFAVNNQEYFRQSCSSEIDERTLREIYLNGFETVVKEAQPRTIMCSYNKINGIYAAENKQLLTSILRDEWGFQGAVVTDWGAVADRLKGMKAGLELEMPGNGGLNDEKIVAAVESGELQEAELNQCVEKILNVIFNYIDNKKENIVFDHDADYKKAVDAETECAVLLENHGVLPLKGDCRVAYIGEFAKKPRYQGGGSSHINASKVVSAVEAAEEKGRSIIYSRGFSADKDEMSNADFEDAVRAAETADIAVIFAGLPDIFESEGYDREHMRLPDCQNKLIEEIQKVQKNIVVVLHNGSPVETPWAEKVSAILEMYLGGQGVGESTDRLLFGEVNPSGRLAETFPVRLEDNPSFLNFPGNGREANYREGIYVGYRYYEKKKIPVRWAFGHGLSYTTFQYNELKLSSRELDDQSTIEVSVNVTNTGELAGKEVIQLYISDKNKTPDRPVKELKGFKKIMLQPGETKTVTMTVDARALSYYETRCENWYAPSGIYEILIGHSSDDIRLSDKISFKTRKIIPMKITGSTTLGELIADNRTAPVIAGLMTSLSAGRDHLHKPTESDQKMMEAMQQQMPLKSLASLGGAQVAAMMDMLIEQLNAAVGNVVRKEE